MIEKLEIQNFQSHKYTELEFSPGVNVIIGPSDSGKSSIIRALRWVIWNRPLGDAFVSHWAEETTVAIKTNDCVVERFKGKGGDKYMLLTDDGMEVLEFKAFGTAPPDEILEALDLSELNVQNQHDNAFLISNSPGEVSRHFNKIANIDKIDSSLRAVESWVRSINQNITAIEHELERDKDKLKSFDYLDKLEAEIEVLEQLESKVNQTINQKLTILNLIESVEEVEEEIKEHSDILSMEGLVTEILELYEQRTEQFEKYSKLKTISLNLSNCRKEIKEHQAILKDQGQVDLVLGLYNKVNETQTQVNKLQALLNKEEETDRKILSAEGVLEDLETKWHENMPDICPLCEQEVAI